VGHKSRPCFSLDRTNNAVGVAGDFGYGAPAAAHLLEELIAQGARRFISIGLAGALARPLRIGDVVVCSEAVRDEGVSHHYLPPARTATASPALTARLNYALDHGGLAYTTGTTWTIDAPYRETIEEIRHYQESGVATVEMEAAALFAVGEARGVDVAAAFVVSDSVADLSWDQQFHDAREALAQLYDRAAEALLPD
jgi:uridine phosphorylase